MSTQYPISTIVQFAENSQVNSQLKISQDLLFKGGSLNTNYSRLLYLVRRGVDFMNNANPANPTLRQTGEYLLALSRPFIANVATISITNPSNQNLPVGATAVFSVSVFVSNAAPFTIQWFRNNVAIPGATSATYSLANVQSTDSGAQFKAIATSPGIGQAVSTTVTLTVTSLLTGFFAYSPTTDFYPILLTNSDPFVYQANFPITHNSPVVVTLPGAMPSNQFMLVKVPIGESIKTLWVNSISNSGTIPDSVFESIVQFGGFTYYASRGQITMDVTKTLTLS